MSVHPGRNSQALAKPVACLLFLLIADAAHAAQAAPAAWGLPALMRTLSQVHSASADFTERKTMAMLNAPLITSGTLRYVAPDYVAKTTISPAPESFVLDHGMVTMVTGATRENFAIATQPQIGGLVEAIRATLAGDLPALNRFYAVRLTGAAANWQILLQPKDPALAHFLRWIIVQGSGNRITAIDTASGGNDHSEMGVNETVGDAR
jgi:hypothetical protein